MKNILITGGAGYIGSLLVNKLLSYGHKITVIDNLRYGINFLNNINPFYYQNLKFINGDVRDNSLILNCLKSADIVIPLAALVGAPLCELYKKDAVEINETAIKNIAENISSNQKIIFPNTNSGYGIGSNDLCTELSELNPISLYGRTKMNAEKFVSNSKNFVCFRLATVFGVSYRMRFDLIVNNFILNALTDNYLVIFEGSFRRNFIHIEDLTDVIIQAIHSNLYDNEIFNLGNSKLNMSKIDLANTIKKSIPKLYINESKINQDPDKRDYLVSNKKIEDKGFVAQYDIGFAIDQIKTWLKLNQNNFRNY